MWSKENSKTHPNMIISFILQVFPPAWNTFRVFTLFLLFALQVFIHSFSISILFRIKKLINYFVVSSRGKVRSFSSLKFKNCSKIKFNKRWFWIEDNSYDFWGYNAFKSLFLYEYWKILGNKLIVGKFFSPLRSKLKNNKKIYTFIYT